MSFITKFLKDESGATAIEYGLIAALIAVGLVFTLKSLKNDLKTNFDNIGTELRSAGTKG